MKKSIKEKRISTEDKIQALAEYKGVEIDEVEEGYDENHFEVDGEEWIVADYDTAYDLAVEDARSVMEDDLGLDALSEFAQEWAIDNACDSDWFDEAQQESNEFYAQDVWEESDTDYGNRAIQELDDNEGLDDEEGGFVIEVSKDGEFFYVDKKGELTDDLYKAKRFLTSSNVSKSKEFNKYYDLLDEEYDDVYDTFEEELVDKDDICERLAESMWEDDSIEWYKNVFGDEELSQIAREKGLFDWQKIAEYCVDNDGVANYLSRHDGKEIELANDLYGYRTE